MGSVLTPRSFDVFISHLVRWRPFSNVRYGSSVSCRIDRLARGRMNDSMRSVPSYVNQLGLGGIPIRFRSSVVT